MFIKHLLYARPKAGFWDYSSDPNKRGPHCHGHFREGDMESNKQTSSQTWEVPKLLLGRRSEARRGTFRHGSLEEVTVQWRPEGFKGAAVEEQGAAC